MIHICSVCKQEYEITNPFQEEELCTECIFELLSDSDSDFTTDDNLENYSNDY
jgi:rubredoxin